MSHARRPCTPKNALAVIDIVCTIVLLSLFATSFSNIKTVPGSLSSDNHSVFCTAFYYPPSITRRENTSTQQLTNKGYLVSESKLGPMPDSTDSEKQRGARVAFLGNSILYFNDTPRFLVQLGKCNRETGAHNISSDNNHPFDTYVEYQDSCLRGGASLKSLWEEGNGMLKHGFATNAAKIIASSDDDKKEMDIYDIGSPTVQSLLEYSNADINNNQKGEKWDFVIMNDYTQGPARVASRKESEVILLAKYAPLFINNQAIPIIIETASYLLPGINDSEDLGSTHEFQQSVREGIDSYLNALQSKLPAHLCPRMAPVGTAFLYVHDHNRAQWKELFDPWDNFHPSPTGTFLQGCVLHCTMFGCPPPLPNSDEEIAALWKDARMMHPKKKEGYEVRLPKVDEVAYLWGVAKRICEEEKTRRKK